MSMRIAAAHGLGAQSVAKIAPAQDAEKEANGNGKEWTRNETYNGFAEK
jgi:hypothetical protein